MGPTGSRPDRQLASRIIKVIIGSHRPIPQGLGSGFMIGRLAELSGLLGELSGGGPSSELFLN